MQKKSKAQKICTYHKNWSENSLKVIKYSLFAGRLIFLKSEENFIGTG